MQGWTWWTLSAPLGVFGIPSSCTRRVVLVATRRTRCSHAASLLTPGCASVPTEPAAAPPHGREAVDHPCDRQMTFLDHLGSSWPSAEAQRVRQSSKVHMAGSRNRWRSRSDRLRPPYRGSVRSPRYANPTPRDGPTRQIFRPLRGAAVTLRLGEFAKNSNSPRHRVP